MSFRDDLRPASFRGIPFFISQSEAEFGQRSVSHTFPNRDEPYQEPLGRRQRVFQVEGYVIGDDYFQFKNRLIAACESREVGELIHPFFNERQVICEQVRVRESQREGRMATLTFTFREAGQLRFPLGAVNAVQNLNQAGDVLKQRIAIEQGNRFSLSNVSGFVRDSVRGKIASLRRTLSGVSAGITSPTDSIDRLNREINALDTDIESFIATPDLLSNQIGDIFTTLGQTVSSAENLFSLSQDNLSFGNNDTTLTQFETPQRSIQQNNEEILNRRVQTEFVIQASNAAAEINHASVDDALEKREIVYAKLLELSEQTTDDNVYQAIRDQQAALVEAVPDPERTLPRVVQVQNRVTRASLPLLYETYQSVNLEEDLVDRNRVEHPGFVPAGNLDVLNDA